MFFAIIASHAALAGGRKSAADSSDRGLFAERFVAAAPGSVHRATFALAPVTASGARAEQFVEAHATAAAAGQRERAAGPIDRNITLWRFNTKTFGEVGVHPLLGPMKGLQVSVGF